MILLLLCLFYYFSIQFWIFINPFSFTNRWAVTQPEHTSDTPYISGKPSSNPDIFWPDRIKNWKKWLWLGQKTLAYEPISIYMMFHSRSEQLVASMSLDDKSLIHYCPIALLHFWSLKRQGLTWTWA